MSQNTEIQGEPQVQNWNNLPASHLRKLISNGRKFLGKAKLYYRVHCAKSTLCIS